LITPWEPLGGREGRDQSRPYGICKQNRNYV